MNRPLASQLAAAGIAAAALLSTASAYAAPVSVVTPDSAASSPGNAQGPAPFRFFGSGGSHSQVVYSASFFQATGALSITDIYFRPFPGFTPSGFFGNTLNVSDVTVRLSTTGRLDESGTPLSTSFASNLGADASTVYSGALTLTTAATGTPVRDFDYRIALQTPFAYDPRLGNLLLDVTIPVGATVSGQGFGFGTFDNVNTLNDGVYSVVDVNSGASQTGFAGTDGAIARFDGNSLSGAGVAVVPVPAAMPLMLGGLLGLGAFARRRSQRKPPIES